MVGHPENRIPGGSLLRPLLCRLRHELSARTCHTFNLPDLARRTAALPAWDFNRSGGRAEEVVDTQTLKRRATLANGLVWKLRTVLGLMGKGSVDTEALLTWVSEARRLCEERGRRDVGYQQIDQVLANAPAGKDGIWPCEPVRDLPDSLVSRHIRIGFVFGKSNLRGVTSRTLFEGGKQEWSFFDKYREDATKIAARWPFTAQLLRDLASSYGHEARREDQQADWSDKFEA